MSKKELQLRPELAKFAQTMERVLRSNDHKGGWQDEHLYSLFARLNEEVNELREAIGFSCKCCGHTKKRGGYPHSDRQKVRVIREVADVANFCMMIADILNDD